jgi:rhodanese-related sulfurtransferase
MQLSRFLHILAVTAALSAYGAWLRMERARQPEEGPGYRSVVGIPLLRLPQVEALWHDPATVFLDVRSSIDYEYGHIAGAISMPEEEFDERFPALKPRLERARVIVVYCKSVDCGKSLWVALRLRDAGLAQTQIYPHGWHEWFEHNLPVTRSATR